MRRTTKLACCVISAIGIGLVACDGGGGSLPTQWDGWDTDRGNLSAREQPPSRGAQDTPLNSADPRAPGGESPPSTGGGQGGALVCSGIYECLVTGTTRTCVTGENGEQNCTTGQSVTIRVRIALQEKNGVCFIGEAVLEPNGVLRGDDADEVGTWSKQGSTLIIKAGTSSGTCVPSSGPVGIVGSDGQVSEGTGSASGSGGSTQTDPPPVVDTDAGI